MPSFMCNSCGSRDLSFSVALFIHAPIEYYTKITKEAIRSKDISLQGANWLNSRIWCNDCGVSLLGTKGTT